MLTASKHVQLTADREMRFVLNVKTDKCATLLLVNLGDCLVKQVQLIADCKQTDFAKC